MAAPMMHVPADLQPHVLYCRAGNTAQFATWKLAAGHETLALFTSSSVAEAYRADLPNPADWTVLQPPRDKLLEILKACRDAGILYATLDPLSGSAKTLFDIPRVLAAANQGVAGGEW